MEILYPELVRNLYVPRSQTPAVCFLTASILPSAAGQKRCGCVTVLLFFVAGILPSWLFLAAVAQAL